MTCEMPMPRAFSSPAFLSNSLKFTTEMLKMLSVLLLIPGLFTAAANGQERDSSDSEKFTPKKHAMDEIDLFESLTGGSAGDHETPRHVRGPELRADAAEF